MTDALTLGDVVLAYIVGIIVGLLAVFVLAPDGYDRRS